MRFFAGHFLLFTFFDGQEILIQRFYFMIYICHLTIFSVILYDSKIWNDKFKNLGCRVSGQCLVHSWWSVKNVQLNIICHFSVTFRSSEHTYFNTSENCLHYFDTHILGHNCAFVDFIFQTRNILIIVEISYKYHLVANRLYIKTFYKFEWI